MSYFDSAETRNATAREAAIAVSLPQLIAHAKTHAPYFASLLQSVNASSILDRANLATLPVTRKSDLLRLQADAPPFGGMLATTVGDLARIFVSPGPIYDPEGRTPDYWSAARCLFAAGFRAGDIVHNAFSYHLTPAGSMFETGLHALGAAVIPGGTGQTEQQLAMIAALKPNGYVGTPSFLKILIERAQESGVTLGSIQRALVSGEAFLPAARQLFADHAIDAYQCYGTADLGLIAYETSARVGLVVNESVLVEIVRPGTGDPVPDGEVGEVVVTALTNMTYPLIRFATGDLSAVLVGESPCGRTNQRIKGWMGRADQTTKVRGMFVHPHQVAAIAKAFPEAGRMRLVVTHDADGNDQATLWCQQTREITAEAIAHKARDATKLRVEVAWVSGEPLANDGKVIDDQRKVV
jgi:phenylacetate-CoA ligase